MGREQTTVNYFGQRLKQLIEFLVREEEPKLVVLARRLGIPAQTLSAWRRGTQTSINKGFAELANCAKVEERSIRQYLEGKISIETIKDERERNTPLAKILRDIDRLSIEDQFNLNYELAVRLQLRNKQRVNIGGRGLSTASSSSLPYTFIQFELAEQARLQRYFEEVKKTCGDSEKLIKAAVDAGADEKSARALVGDILMGDITRQYCAENFESFLPFLPRIVGWKGENPILDPTCHWQSFEEIVEEIKEQRSRYLQNLTC